MSRRRGERAKPTLRNRVTGGKILRVADMSVPAEDRRKHKTTRTTRTRRTGRRGRG
jgi:hypothetical protein